MADRVLPSREAAGDWAERYKEVIGDRSMVRIVQDYASNELMTAAEWRETIDYAAARRIIDETEIWGPRNRERLARRVVDAALGEPTTAVKEIIDEDQELLGRLAET